ncbi:hypothetical protein AIOL_000809 [Candidatus Rhodobacter oscarellae]|uniref:Uncharacterized protein n=1 Tax=Candidatus Rhodobacter oscarellae TaxID=1675527 RepID=A0A0J9ED60_9RHOB|nr:hypothetical protein [Candidatus Rhodobacter lobularis]KMW60645.1 hypothetical protein AIOL_000809 [Candidatus Rhodobacter lobularis]
MKLSFWQRVYWLWQLGWLRPAVLLVVGCALFGALFVLIAPRPHAHERFELARVVSSMAAQSEDGARFLMSLS